MLRTSNPALNNPAFAGQGAAQTWGDLGMDSYDAPAAATPAAPAARADVMTMQGTVNKSAFLIALTVTSAVVGWRLMESNPGLMMPFWIVAMVAMIGGPILACMKPKLSAVTAPIVALALGPFVGGFSMMAANMTSSQSSGITAGIPDLILNAGLLTFGIFGGLLAAALGQASVLAADLSGMDRVKNLRDRFWTALCERFGKSVVLNGHLTERLPNTLNVSFAGRSGADILAALDGVAASTGSACHSGRVKLSPVLAAMGVPPEIGMGAIRFSLGRETTQQEIDTVVERLSKVLADVH